MVKYAVQQGGLSLFIQFFVVVRFISITMGKNNNKNTNIKLTSHSHLYVLRSWLQGRLQSAKLQCVQHVEDVLQGGPKKGNPLLAAIL